MYYIYYILYIYVYICKCMYIGIWQNLDTVVEVVVAALPQRFGPPPPRLQDVLRIY